MPRRIRTDTMVEFAGGMTFFLLFSLFPALVFLVTLLPYLPVEAPLEELFDIAQPFMPPEVYELLYGRVEELVNTPRTGLLTISAAIALFAASRALVSLSRSLNRSYGVEAPRSEILRRLRSIGLTLLALLGIIVAVLALSLGDQLVLWIVSRGWLPISSGALIVAVRWPLLLVIGAFLVQQLYFLLPDVRPRWRAISTGSLFAVVSWVTATWAFTAFATRFIKFSVTYGSLSSFAVVMAWMFLGSFALMAGGLLNALVDRGLGEEDPSGTPPSTPSEAVSTGPDSEAPERPSTM